MLLLIYCVQVGLIERALAGFKHRMREKSGIGPGFRVRITASTLEKVLASYGITVTEIQLQHIMSSCSWAGCKRANSKVNPIADGEGGGDDVTERPVSFQELLTSVPLWRLIAVSWSGSQHCQRKSFRF